MAIANALLSKSPVDAVAAEKFELVDANESLPALVHDSYPLKSLGCFATLYAEAVEVEEATIWILGVGKMLAGS